MGGKPLALEGTCRKHGGQDLNLRPSGYEPQYVVCSGTLYFSHIFDIAQHIKTLCDLAIPHDFAAILNISCPHDSIVIPLVKFTPSQSIG